MNIIHFVRTCDPRSGGPIEGVCRLGKTAISQGHTVTVATLDGPEAPWIKDFPLPCLFIGPSKGNYGWAPDGVSKVLRALPQVDVVVINGLWQQQGALVRRIYRRGPIPYVIFPHGMLDPWFKRSHPLKHLKKQLYWFHKERHTIRDADLVLFTAEQERLLAQRTFWPYQARERVVGYGTVDPGTDDHAAKAAFLAQYPQLAHTRNLLFLSRLHHKKGCDLLIAAFVAVAPAHPDLRLIMAGPDEEQLRPGLETAAKAGGVADRIVWTGMIQGEIKQGAFAACEAFVLPSHQENFGIAVAEALAAGRPVLISDQINIFNEIAADQAGLIERDTVAGATRLLQRWLAMSVDQRQAMGLAARACFLKRFEIGAATRSFIAALTEAKAIRAKRVAEGDA